MKLLETYFRELDALIGKRDAPATLRIIGSTALMSQSDYSRATKDLDVIETAALDAELIDELHALGGKQTRLATKYNMYLDIVGNAVPFLPQRPVCHPVLSLERLELEVVDVVDVVVSKLKPFRPADLQDIEAMVDRRLVDHGKLVDRFYDAMDFFQDARADEALPRFVQNLNTVERDILAVPESDIEMPSWLR